MDVDRFNSCGYSSLDIRWSYVMNKKELERTIKQQKETIEKYRSVVKLQDERIKMLELKYSHLWEKAKESMELNEKLLKFMGYR